MNWKSVAIVSFLVSVAVILFICVRLLMGSSAQGITVIEIVDSSRMGNILLEKTSAKNIKELYGTYAVITSEFAREATSKRIPRDGKLVIVVGREPISVGERGVLICRVTKNPNVIYLCQIKDKTFDAFSAAPPFTFQEVKIEASGK